MNPTVSGQQFQINLAGSKMQHTVAANPADCHSPVDQKINHFLQVETEKIYAKFLKLKKASLIIGHD